MLPLILLTALFSAPSQAAFSCPAPWVCKPIQLKSGETLRSGHLPQNPKVPFLGNILYFEGLGDSMMNHQPLFTKLTDAGFRVIAFDYLGQGGSNGKMSKTVISMIPDLGDIAWKNHADDLKHFPKKRIIGWSTGGLAAYYAAYHRRADQIVLIAPGIRPNKIVGEGLWHWPVNEITLESLTTDRYSAKNSNPHVDPIRPTSPMKVFVPFGVNLLATANHSKSWKIDSAIPGFVLLSGDEDTYVNAKKTRETIEENASHFSVKAYPGSLHEIDNERLEIREEAHRDILNFLLNGTI
jgi:alpha-beta hydrolase superfamily lysophospholipase